MTTAENIGTAGAAPLSDDAQRMYRGSIWLVILAETMIFATLFSNRFLLAGRGGPVEPTDPIGLGISLAFIVSLIPVGLGLCDPRRRGRRNVALADRHGIVRRRRPCDDLCPLESTLSFAAASRGPVAKLVGFGVA